MVRAHSLPDMAHFITGASKAVFEHATVCRQEALTGQQDGDLAASSAHSPPGLCGRCPPPLLQLCQEDLSSFLGHGSEQGMFADPWICMLGPYYACFGVLTTIVLVIKEKHIIFQQDLLGQVALSFPAFSCQWFFSELAQKIKLAIFSCDVTHCLDLCINRTALD